MRRKSTPKHNLSVPRTRWLVHPRGTRIYTVNGSGQMALPQYPYSGKRILSARAGAYRNHPHRFRRYKAPDRARDITNVIPYRKYARYVELAKGHTLSWARRFANSRTYTDNRAFARAPFSYSWRPKPFGFGEEL